MKARHWITLAVFLVGGALLAGIFLRLSSDEEDGGGGATGDPATDSVRAAVQSTAAQSAFATEIALPVEGAVIHHDTFVVWVEATGRAAPRRSADLRADVSGPVVRVPVREGGTVAAGGLIAQIDPTLYDIRVKQAEATLEQRRAEFRDRVLFDDRIEDPAVREERARQARIRVGLDQQEAVLEEARYELAKTTITAPFAGRIANLAVTEGSRVTQGDSVGTVLDLSQVEIEAEVLHTELSYVEVGREATATFPGLPGESFRGRVVSVNPRVARETQTARVTLRLANPEAKIVPGMPGKVRIAGRLLPNRMYVPKEAIVERSRRQVIFVFEPDEPGSATGRAQWKYVTTGLENDRFVEIVEGPEGEDTFVPRGGEIVLVDGHATLTHDARVQIENRDALRPDAGSGEPANPPGGDGEGS